MMRRGALFVGIVVVLGALGWIWLAHRPPALSETATSVGAAGITLTSQTRALPEAPSAFPGADGEVLTVTCTACHSPEMILAQPRMPADKWQAEIDKMRKAYRASVDPKDDARLVAALLALPAQRVGTGSAPE